MDYSFYGGRRGASFVIAGRYSSISAMVSAFARGNNYSTINYDEYVIIDTTNKNDADNGKIYRRGYDYQNNMGGAIYVGQVVGPGGMAPAFEMTPYDDVINKAAIEGFEYRKKQGSLTSATQDLLPGKSEDAQGNPVYKDAIEWAACSVRDVNNKDTVAYLGVKVPYTVIECDADTVSPYYNRNSEFANFTNTDLVDRVDDKTHPFYEKWHISVPKGIKGDTLNNFRVVPASSVIQDYPGRADDIANNRQVMIYDYYHFDKESSGEPVTLYLGDFNVIKDVTFDNDGTLKVFYTHDDTNVWTNKVKWITDISLTQAGVLTVNFNYGGESTKYQTTLEWIDKASVLDDGTVVFTYNDHANGVQDIHIDNLIKWVTGVNLAEDGTFTFSYNNGTEDSVFSKIAKWITNVTLNDNGTLTINYNNGATATVFNNKLKWITNIELEDDGTITVNYNNGDPSVFTKTIKWITSTEIKNGAILVHYNTGATDTLPIEYYAETVCAVPNAAGTAPDDARNFATNSVWFVIEE